MINIHVAWRRADSPTHICVHDRDIKVDVASTSHVASQAHPQAVCTALGDLGALMSGWVKVARQEVGYIRHSERPASDTWRPSRSPRDAGCLWSDPRGASLG